MSTPKRIPLLAEHIAWFNRKRREQKPFQRTEPEVGPVNWKWFRPKMSPNHK